RRFVIHRTQNSGGERVIGPLGGEEVVDESHDAVRRVVGLGDDAKVAHDAGHLHRGRNALPAHVPEDAARARSGLRNDTIVEELNADGVPSPRSGKWSVGTVRSIIVNPLYRGANVWNMRSFSKYHRIENRNIQQIEESEAGGLRRNDEAHWIVADDAHGFDAIV